MMKNEDNLKKIITIFNGYQFFFALLWWVPIFYAYQKQMGLNDTEIFKIQSLYYIIFCLLEIPTGYLADRIGYKVCLKLGGFTLLLANIWVPIDPSYQGFLIHFILVALARSFVSGASSAYLYEMLKSKNLLDEYKEAEGRARAISLIGKIICWGLVGYTMKYMQELPYWLTALNAFISIFFAYKLPDLENVAVRQKPSIFKIFETLKTHPTLLLIMLQGVALFVLARICQVNLFQPLLTHKGFDIVTFGVIMAIMTIFEAIGSFRSKWVKRFFSDLYATFFFTCCIGLSFYIMSFEKFLFIDTKILTIIALSFFSFIIGISFPIQRQLVNGSIHNPELRASLLSVESIIDRAANSLVASYLAAVLSAGKLLLFLEQVAFVTIISVFIITMIIRKKGLAREKTIP
jgi:MFS family permease